MTDQHQCYFYNGNHITWQDSLYVVTGHGVMINLIVFYVITEDYTSGPFH